MLTIKWVASAKMYQVNYNGFKRWFNMRDFEQLHAVGQLKKEMGALTPGIIIKNPNIKNFNKIIQTTKNSKEYLVHYTDEVALPVGLVYDYKDIMAMFNIAKTKASYIYKAIKQGQPFSVDGVEYDSIEIKEAYDE